MLRPKDFGQLMAGGLTVGIWLAIIYRFAVNGIVESELLGLGMFVLGWWAQTPKVESENKND